MNLVFTGFMGTGKSTVGKIIAEKLDRVFFDTDEMIEDNSGQSISGIFRDMGEDVFRKLESETVGLLSAMNNIVISCGGGVVVNPKNIEALRKNGIIVNLYASPEHLFERLSESDHRPLIKRMMDPLGEIKKLLESRRDAYKNCDFAFNTEGLTPQQSAEEILKDENIMKLINK